MFRFSESRVRAGHGVRGLALLAAVSLPTLGRAQAAIPPMLGAWQADARLVVDWTRRRILPVHIVIHADDRVTGTVGEAELVEGRLLRYRDGTRTLRWKADYIIDANLSGPIIRAENVWRTSVEMELAWYDDHFEGGLVTPGWKVGGTERKALAATLVFLRPLAAFVCEIDPMPFLR